MNKNKYNADIFLWSVTRVMWFLLSVSAVYILWCTVNITVAPQEMLGMYHMIPEMVEYLLAGCVILLGIGVLFEYLSKY